MVFKQYCHVYWSFLGHTCGETSTDMGSNIQIEEEKKKLFKIVEGAVSQVGKKTRKLQEYYSTDQESSFSLLYKTVQNRFCLRTHPRSKEHQELPRAPIK